MQPMQIISTSIHIHYIGEIPRIIALISSIRSTATEYGSSTCANNRDILDIHCTLDLLYNQGTLLMHYNRYCAKGLLL